MSTVLVTGGSGFIGLHTILQLISAGHQVRTTIRSLSRESEVRATLTKAGAAPDAPFSVFAADLSKDNGWKQAATGCDFVLHIASPFPASLPKHEDELIVPARDGALRVLRAARDAGAKRVVLTSSFAAIGYGHTRRDTPFDETSWTNLSGPGVSPYAKSKTIAERTAWDFMAKEGGPLELAVVNPVGVFGPVFGPDYATSILIVKRLLDGSIPGCPQISFGVVDVRDVVDLHLRAMTNRAAKGERFLAVAGDSISMLDIAKLLKSHLGDAAKKVPTRQLPNWLLRVIALIDPEVRQIVPELGRVKHVSNEKAKRVLHWSPRSNEDALLSTAQSLIRLNLVNKPR